MYKSKAISDICNKHNNICKTTFKTQKIGFSKLFKSFNIFNKNIYKCEVKRKNCIKGKFYIFFVVNFIFLIGRWKHEKQ